MTQALQAQIRTRVAACIALAERTFGITLPQVAVLFDLTGRAAGVAGCRGNSYYLRFNTRHMAMGGQTWQHLINDTVPHEVAHTVCQAFPQFGHAHDAGWRRVCLALGGNGRRTYSEADAPEAVAAMRPYVYVTTTGSELRVTKGIHTKIQRGVSYSTRDGKGSVNRTCHYSYMAAATQPRVAAQPTAPVAAQPQVAAQGTSKADLIRAQLAQGVSAEACVTYGVEVLGMSRALAKTYVKNNSK
jgi:predicted SprT family Zn-dependent metalloprotease